MRLRAGWRVFWLCEAVCGWVKADVVLTLCNARARDLKGSPAASRRLAARKSRHRQAAAAVVNAAKRGKAVVVFDRLRRPAHVAEDIRQAAEMGVKVRVRVAGEGITVSLAG